MKILVVDDEVFARKTYRRILSNKDVEIVEASDAYSAYCKYEEERPDIVISDIMMKGIGGDWLISKLLEKFPDANIIVCSGKPKIQLLKYRLIGAKAILSKPINYNNLWYEIDAILGRD